LQYSCLKASHYYFGAEKEETFVGRPNIVWEDLILFGKKVQGGSNMTGTDLYVNKPHCAAAVRP